MHVISVGKGSLIDDLFSDCTACMRVVQLELHCASSSVLLILRVQIVLVRNISLVRSCSCAWLH